MDYKFILTYVIWVVAVVFLVVFFYIGKKCKFESLSPLIEILIAVFASVTYFFVFTYFLSWERIEHGLLLYFQKFNPNTDVKFVEIIKEGVLPLLSVLNSLIILTGLELGRTKRRQLQISEEEKECEKLKSETNDKASKLNAYGEEINRRREDLNAARKLYEIFNVVPRDLQNAIDGLFDLSDPFADHVGSQFRNFTAEIKESGIFLNRNVDLYVNHIEGILRSITSSDKEWEIFMTCLVPPQWFSENDDSSLHPNERGISSLIPSKVTILNDLLRLYQNTAEFGIAVKRLIIFDDYDIGIMKLQSSNLANYGKGIEELVHRNAKVDHYITDGRLLNHYLSSKMISPSYLNSLDFIAFGLRENDNVKWQYVVMYNVRGEYLRIMWWNNTDVMRNVSGLYESLQTKGVPKTFNDYIQSASNISWPQVS